MCVDRVRGGMEERQDIINLYHWDCPHCGQINEYEDIECTECGEPDQRLLSDYSDDDGCCNTCGGEGFILTCCDDICHGLGHCIHSDGEIPCPDCDGPY